MKKILLSLIFCVFITKIKAQNISDNFDSYQSNSLLAIQSNGLWSTWSNSPGGNDDAPVSSDFSNSGANSVKLETGGTVDVILPLGDQTSGRWNMSFMMYIPTNKGGYFNMLHEFNGSNSNWAFDVFFSETGEAFLAIGGSNSTNTQPFYFSHDKWFEVNIIIDIDSGSANAIIDGASISWNWTEGSSESSSNIGALNLYAFAPQGEDGLYYVDDVNFNLTNLNCEEHGLELNLYPNPTSSFLNIQSSKFIGGKLDIFTALGASVYKQDLFTINNRINCSLWEPGIYFIQSTSVSGYIETKKFVVK